MVINCKPPPQLTMLLFTPINSLFLLVVLLDILCSESAPCFSDGMQISAYADNYDMGFQDLAIADFKWTSFGTLCVGSHLLCFYSMLPGMSSLYAASTFSGCESGVVRPVGSIRQAVGWISYSSWLTDGNLFRVSRGTALSSPLSSREGGNEFAYWHSDGLAQSYAFSYNGDIINQEIQETWKRNSDVIKVVPFDGSSLYGPTCLRQGSAIAESTPINTYVYLHTRSYLGNIFFHISNPCTWQCSFCMRNNLSDLQKPIYTCSWSGYKDIYAKIIENLTAEVRNVGKKACLLGEFIVHTGTSLASESRESAELLISYKTDSLATSAHNNIRNPVIPDILATPMKESLTSCMINVSRMSVFLVQMNKYCVIPFLAAFLMLLIFCCLFSLLEAMRSEDCFYKNASKQKPSSQNLGNPSHVHQDMKSGKSTLSSSDSRISRQESVCKNPDQGMGRHKLTSLHGNGNGNGNGLEDNYVDKISVYSPRSPVEIVDFDTLGASPTAELTIRKRRDRKKQQNKNIVADARLTETLKDSSSIGGKCNPSPANSTVALLMSAPTCSLSPQTNGSNEPKNLFSQAAGQHKRKSQVSASKAKILESSVSIKFQSTSFSPSSEDPLPRKTYSRALMLSFSAFQSADWPASDLLCCSPILASRSTVSPYERAPGSKLTKQKNVKTEETAKLGDKFTYDIWGDHLSGVCLMRKPIDVSVSSGSGLSSFFVRGPQVLFAEFHPRSVSVH